MNPNEPSAFEVYTQTFMACIEGLPLTLLLTAAAVVLGLVLAIPLAVLHSRHRGIPARSVRLFVFFFTGTPLLVQMYIFYQGFPEFEWVQDLMDTPAFDFLKDAYVWVLLAFTLNTTAYLVEIFSGAIKNTDNGEVEAGRAYGMTSGQVMRHIILPSSLRRALPAYSNEVIMMLQSTSLASSFTLFEIMGQTMAVYSKTYRPFPAFIAAGTMYLLLTFVMVYGFKLAEKRYLTHLKPRSH